MLAYAGDLHGEDSGEQCSLLARDVTRDEVNKLYDAQSEQRKKMCFTVPMEFIDLYNLDPEKFFQNVCGISFRERGKYFTRKDKVLACFKDDQPSIFRVMIDREKRITKNHDVCMRLVCGAKPLMRNQKKLNLDFMRSVHVDMSAGADATP